MTREVRAAVRRRIARRDTLTRAVLIAAVVLALVLAAAYTWLDANTWDVARNRLLNLRPGQSDSAAVKRVALPAVLAPGTGPLM